MEFAEFLTLPKFYYKRTFRPWIPKYLFTNILYQYQISVRFRYN